MQKLTKKTKAELAEYIHDAMTFNRTNNHLDAKIACLAIIVLSSDYGIRLPSLNAARDMLKTLEGN